MSWEEVTVVEKRKRFMQLLEQEDCPGVAALSREFGISRKTAYKWIGRFKLLGEPGLVSLSRAAHTHPNAISAEVEQWVLDVRQKFPSWGGKKLLRWLEDNGPNLQWPSLAGTSAILDRNQVVKRRKRKRPVERFEGGLSKALGSNDVWSIDHKGWWLASNGDKCEPFTISDLASRYLIRCTLRPGKGIEYVRPILTAAFQEYGLPVVIRSDNGAPFASRAPLGLSPLSVWLLRLGIIHERIDAGKPQQNGSHERMHLTMLQERNVPIGRTLRQEQSRLNIWREVFNNERPHEALELDTPASRYQASPRAMPRRLPAIEYQAHMRVRKVDCRGQVGWKTRSVFLSEALAGEFIGFEPTEADGIWTMWLANMQLGTFNEKPMKVGWAKAPKRAQTREMP